MTTAVSDPADVPPVPPPLRGGPWPKPPTYDRCPDEQAAFDGAVARLWAEDAWPNPITGQRELNADLVLEGGGVKGIGLTGAICVLAEAGYRFPRAAGTSAGAIAAVLVAAVEKSGKDMTVLRDYLQDIDYSNFMSTRWHGNALGRLIGKLACVGSFMFRGGLYSGDYLRTWLGAKLSECGISSWADLALSVDDDPGMSLPEDRQYRAVVHVSDLSRGMLARLPWDYRSYYGLDPADQDVVSAVRASMSIPFFFVPVQMRTRPARTQFPDGHRLDWPGGTVTCVDGGMLMNFPINAFERADDLPPRWPTFGIKLSAEPGPQPADSPVSNGAGEACRCIETMMSEWDRYHVDQAGANRIIFVPNHGISATQFDLSKEQQNALFLSGAQAATHFVISWAGRVRTGSPQAAPRKASAAYGSSEQAKPGT
jgi:NTE family protein